MKKVAIIGAGPGGYHAAMKLANACEVTVIDKEYIGGTCLNIGCIPTKVLLDHISLFEHFNEASKKKKIFNEVNTTNKINIQNLVSYQLEIIKQLAQGLEKLFKKKNIKFISGSARITKDRKVLIKSEDKVEEIEVDEIIIATGSRPKMLQGFVFDKTGIVSSNDIWNIPKVPETLLIVGSGPIGIEFARIFSALGSKVTLIEIEETICPVLDKEISENLSRSLKKRNIILKSNLASRFLEKKENKVFVELLNTVNNQKEIQAFDQVLVAVGRTPNTQDLGLEEVGVELERGAFVKVNEYLETVKKNIWAIGDVTNYPQLAHTASFQARITAENILGKKKKFSGDFIPSCIFGYPEVAFVGSTEEALKKSRISYKAGKFSFLASGKAKTSGLTEGIVKILMDERTKKILGAHIIGPEASSLIHELVVAMQNGLIVDQITSSIHAHPTYSEAVLEALEDCLGQAIHV
ncbi:MAG: dihydrolipoyl dehydrogenase [Candidatus Melainabacteria bacterium]|nr:dihydrolipoyl dehydrogenase [Candidatus Melainabacteria bacterium]